MSHLRQRSVEVNLSCEGPPMEQAAFLPSGTVTFLFTDIEGSTRLWEQYPEAMQTALARHDDLLRQAIADHQGELFKTVGDQVCAAFTIAPEALAAALAAQQALLAEPWGQTGPLRVRMALHTGAALAQGGDYLGPPLNRVARLLATGYGGQILLSQATYELVRDALPEGTSLRELGQHRLKDLQRPEQVYQLLHPELPADFPPLNSLDARTHNLPLQLTRFIGREQEMATVKELLAATRLLTLTGAGGCGKTRLALQVAADLVGEYRDGVWLVELGALTDPALVVQAVASAVRVREEPGRPLLDTLLDALRARELLLLLDNCEHLVAAVARLAATLLRECPRLQLLATSREALGMEGETHWRVPPLSLPEPQRRLPLERLSQSEAVRLFIDRALQSQPEFAVTNENAPAVAEICQRLDGIPLAIELAAARLKLSPVEQIAGRLDDRFRLLTGGSRAGLPRQQTLRAAMDWSYDLLSEEEQVLLRRLSVFAGSFSVGAAEAVCARPGLDEWRVAELLLGLAEKSLVAEMEGASGQRPEAREGAASETTSPGTPSRPPETRYRLLETVRQYAAERLQEAGEAPLLRNRHRDFYLALVEQVEPELEGPRQGEWLARLEQEHENLLAALTWSVERTKAEGGKRWLGALAERGWVRGLLRVALRGWAVGDEAASGLRLGAAMGRFWRVRGHWAVGRQRLEELVALAGIAPTAALDGRRRAPGETGTQFKRWISVWGFKGSLAGLMAPFGSLYLFSILIDPPKLLRAAVPESVLYPLPWFLFLGFVMVMMLGPTAIELVLEWHASLRARQLKSAWALRSLDKARMRARTISKAPLRATLSAWPHSTTVWGILLTLGYAGLLVVLLDELSARLLARAAAPRVEALARALQAAGQLAAVQGDAAGSGAYYGEGLVFYRLLGSARNVAALFRCVGTLLLHHGHSLQARSYYETNLRVALRRRDHGTIATSLNGLGSVAVQQGHLAAARALYEESLDMQRKRGDQAGIASSLNCLGYVALRQGELLSAGSLYGESLTIRKALGHKEGIAANLEGLAAVAGTADKTWRAARLFGAAAALRDEMGTCHAPEGLWHERLDASVRSSLGEKSFTAAWAEGRALPLEQAVAFALEEAAPPSLLRTGG